MKYEIILFDLDGVILDFKQCEKASFENTFKQYNIEVNEQLFNLYSKINHQLWHDFELGKVTKNEVTCGRFKILFEKLGLDIDSNEFANQYQNGLAEGYFLMPEAKEILETLSLNYRLYAVTNGVSKTAFSRLKGTDTLKYFKDVFVSEDLNAQKPSIEYFEKVFNKIQPFKKEKVLLIGDTLTSDILGANQANIDCCWLNIDHLVNQTKAKPDYEIDCLKDIFKIL